MCGSSRPTAVRVREQRCASCKIAKLHAILEPNSTLDSLDIETRQPSTALDSNSTRRHMESASTGSTGTRQARQARPRQRPRRSLDSSTARQPGLNNKFRKRDCGCRLKRCGKRLVPRRARAAHGGRAPCRLRRSGPPLRRGRGRGAGGARGGGGQIFSAVSPLNFSKLWRRPQNRVFGV